jgi:integrase
MAKKKLTRALIDEYEPPLENGAPVETILWDQTLPGFGLKVTKAGTKSFIIQYRFGGKTKRLTISTLALLSIERARDDARRKLQMVRDGIDPAQVREDRVNEPTVDDIINAWEQGYMAKFLKNKPSCRNAECQIRQIRAWLGKRQAGAITRKILTDWHSRPEQAERHTAANGIIQRFKWIWEWAEINGHLPKNAPSSTTLFHKFDWYKERKRERAFTDQEYAAFAQAIRLHRERGDLNAKHLTLFELLMFIGGRLRESMFLRYTSGDRNDTNYVRYTGETPVEVILQRHKTWEDSGVKIIPVTPEIACILARCKEFRVVGNDFVFPADRASKTDLHRRGPIKDPYDTFYTLLNTAGITGEETVKEEQPRTKRKGARKAKRAAPGHTRIHDLRHSLISFGINKGIIDPDNMARTIGHADPQTTRRYWHRKEAIQKRASMEPITKGLAEVVNP